MLFALTILYKLENCKTKVWCDNQDTISISNRRLRRIMSCSTCADALRIIRSLKNKSSAVIECGHIDGHTYYRRLKGRQAECPNCGITKLAAHLCMCSNEDRTTVSPKTTEEQESMDV